MPRLNKFRQTHANSIDRFQKTCNRFWVILLFSGRMPKLRPRKSSSDMATLLEAAFHKDQRMAARHSRSPPPTETTAPQLPRVSRPIHLRMQPGRCKLRFAMCPGPADILILQAPTPRLGMISFHLRQQRTSVAGAPATVASQLQGHLMVNHQMWHIGRVQVQVPWVLPARLDLLILLHSYNAVIHHHPTSTCIHLSNSISVECFRFLFPGTFLAFFFFSFF